MPIKSTGAGDFERRRPRMMTFLTLLSLKPPLVKPELVLAARIVFGGDKADQREARR